MAFTVLIKGEMKMPPARTDLPEAGPQFKVWGTFVSDSGSTGGQIDPKLDFINYANVFDEDGANAVRVQCNVTGDGNFTIATTADSSGRWECMGKRRRSK